ncbi:hypothetical protein FE257_011994 [Aspergillus nanangensis]|uniref:Uncharacterized protein n=1 Tax=Aspergillus nanangensis TaxID=2582783 RepID=A0AAD4GQC4_ASPNN|nr:hypothetical protein FE257_011994 [Aspergillus nanangensis]
MHHYLPEADFEIPPLDLLSLLFDSDYPWAKEDTMVYAEASNETNHLTLQQTATWTRRLAYVLRHEFGIGALGPEQDVVTCISSNQVLLPTVFFGVIAAGGIYSAASTALTTMELARQIEQSSSTLIIASPDTADVALKAAQKCNIPASRVLVLRSMAHHRELTSLGHARNYLANNNSNSNNELLAWERITDPHVLQTRIIGLVYSSGTTGVPKGVQLSHSNFVAEAIITQAAIQLFLARTNRQVHVNFTYRALGHLPSAHISGLQGYFINGVMAGGTVFWMGKFEFEAFVAAAKHHQVTFISSVPSVFLRIAKSPHVTDEHFRSLVHAQSGAAPMGSDTQCLVEKKIRCNISQAWGLTETTGAVTWLPWDRSDRTGSISQLLPNTRLMIVDDAGVAVDEGQRGEILVKGPNVTKGYFRNPEATREAFTADGWFRTGDIGLRKDEKFYIVDRKKELIKYKGLQIAPAEIEAVLVSHSSVLDAAVIGIDDPRIPGNEVPRAFVVQDAQQSPLTAQAVMDYVKMHLADHKQLRGGVEFIDQIPRNLSGKILRRQLMDRVKATQTQKARL